MFFELLIFALLGMLLGILTGLVPGLHVNTISLLLLGLAFSMNPYYLAVTIISMAISHTFWDFIPSILLGVPEPSTALSVLPGHQLLLKGKGLEAIYLTLVGGIGVIAVAVILFPIFIAVIPFLYQSVQSYIHVVLIIIAAVILLAEKGIRKLYGLMVFSLSGILGLLLLNSYLLPPNSVLFPVFTGLFGMSNLIISLNRKTRIPKQKLTLPKIPRRLALSGIIKALFSGALVGTLPGIGASQATVLTQQITGKKDEKEFLVSIGAINTIVALFSLISLYTISKARSGAAIAVQEILEAFGFNELILLVSVTLLSTGVSVFLMLRSTPRIIEILQRLDYSRLTIFVIVALTILVYLFTGPLGLFVLFLSTSIGLLAPLFGTKRSNLMGVLIVPLIFFYSGIII